MTTATETANPSSDTVNAAARHSQRATLPNVDPIKRDLVFDVPADRIHDWHADGMHTAHFLNSLSVLFPVGERFFMDAVRKYRKVAKDDPALNEQIAGFLHQEAVHGREHMLYNKALDARGIPASKHEANIGKLLKFIQKHLPDEMSLAATVALEHYTAVLANALLDNPEFLDHADERYAAMWNWHALEETEHKAVAFDVFERAFGRGAKAYTLRVTAMAAATAILWPIVYGFWFDSIRREKGLLNLRGWFKSLNNQFGKPGILRGTIPEMLDWFKPCFHPWQHDNRYFLAMVDEIEAEYDRYAVTTH